MRFQASVLFLAILVPIGYSFYQAYTKKMDTPKPSKEELKQKWMDLSKKVGYEGSALLVQSLQHRLLFLLSEKDGRKQAEICGGKPEEQDRGIAQRTALRELEEEAGVILWLNDIRDAPPLKTTGGTTGMHSLQYVSKQLLSEELVVQPKEHFTGYAWSYVYRGDETCESKWYIKMDQTFVPLRKFNHYVFDQHEKELEIFIAEEVVTSVSSRRA